MPLTRPVVGMNAEFSAFNPSFPLLIASTFTFLFLCVASFLPVLASPSAGSSQGQLETKASVSAPSLGFQDDLLDRPVASLEVASAHSLSVKTPVRTEEEDLALVLTSPKAAALSQNKAKAPALNAIAANKVALKTTTVVEAVKPSEAPKLEAIKTLPATIAATVPATDTLQNYYRVEKAPLVGEVVIRAIVNEKTGEAGLVINEREVAHFRSAFEGVTPDVRSKRAAQRLFDYLISGGTYSGVDVKSSYDRKMTTVTLDNVPLLQVDADTAQKAKHPTTVSLAKVWAEQLRTALGQPKPTPQEKPDTSTLAMRPHTLTGGSQRQINGLASWYGPYFHGRQTASGTRYNMYEMTAAHKTLPFGTKVKVTNQKTGQQCVVTITDRGPYVGPRVIDLSKAAAAAVGMMGSGVARVTLDILGR
jgi:rare lipoprotein A